MSHRTLLEHFAAVMAAARQLPAEVVPVSPAACGRVLAAAATARLPIPPFSNSAMDGFLVRSADVTSVPVTLPVAGDVPAGAAPQEVPAGHAVRIMTGAPIPEAAVDSGTLQVIPVELTDIPAGPHPLPATVSITEAPARRHIRPRGDNLQPGDVAAPAGATVDAGTLAALISAGVPDINVHRLPRVAIVASGDELTSGAAEESAALRPGQLPDSNGPMLAALVHAALVPAAHGTMGGADDTPRPQITCTRAGDSATALAELLDELAATHDVILTTGGVSAGAFDVVHATIEPHCPDAWFGHVAHKPGAPQGLATWNGVPVLCLPGNPVAAFMSFHLYVTSFLRVLAGAPAMTDPWSRPFTMATAASDFPAPRDERTLLVPVRLDFSTGTPYARPYNNTRLGSHMVASLAGTTAFAALTQPVRAGDSVPIYFYEASI